MFGVSFRNRSERNIVTGNLSCQFFVGYTIMRETSPGPTAFRVIPLDDLKVNLRVWQNLLTL